MLAYFDLLGEFINVELSQPTSSRPTLRGDFCQKFFPFQDEGGIPLRSAISSHLGVRFRRAKIISKDIILCRGERDYNEVISGPSGRRSGGDKFANYTPTALSSKKGKRTDTKRHE
jgi:hypothetical protein